MDNYGDNFFFDIAIHDEIYYDKYLTKTKHTLEFMAEDILRNRYYNRLNVPGALDFRILREEDILNTLERRYDLSSKNKSFFARLFRDHATRMDRQRIKKQKEIVVFLHDAKDALNFATKIATRAQ